MTIKKQKTKAKNEEDIELGVKPHYKRRKMTAAELLRNYYSERVEEQDDEDIEDR